MKRTRAGETSLCVCVCICDEFTSTSCAAILDNSSLFVLICSVPPIMHTWTRIIPSAWLDNKCTELDGISSDDVDTRSCMYVSAEHSFFIYSANLKNETFKNSITYQKNHGMVYSIE